MRPTVRHRLGLFFATLFVYAYFFQGFGYNQNAHFDTVRAIVDGGTFEIGPDVQDPQSPTFTMDVAEVRGRTYSNKPPGLPVCCTPVYFIASRIQAMRGKLRFDEIVLRRHLYLLTLFASAIPAALLVVGLFDYFRAKLPTNDALLLASAFAFGSFLLPYSGMLMVHVAVAAMLFFTWRLLDEGRLPLVAGALIGLAITFDISITPLAAIYAWLAATTRGRRELALFLIGPCVGVALILIYQRILFGGFLATPHGFEKNVFLHKHLFLGHFDWPDPRRAYWLTLHPLRGVFYLCPIFVLPLLSLLRAKTPDRRAVLPLVVIAYFFLFNLTFDGWTGGWGAGPRYLIPATPFLFVFAAPALTRFRYVAIALVVVSAVNMLAITAVRAQFPAPTFGPPSADNPVVECIVRVRKDQLAHDPGSFNWGLLMGMKGKRSLVPPLLVIGSLGFAALRPGRTAAEPGDSSTPP